MLSLLLLLAPASQATKPVDFDVGTVSMSMSPPPGYCAPQDAQVAAAQLLAAADDANVTLATLFPCGSGLPTRASDYTIIKAPKQALTTAITLPDFLAAVGPVFDRPGFAEAMAAMAERKANDALAALLGKQASMRAEVAPTGRDARCAYLAGTLRVTTAVGTYDQSMAGCMTVIGGRVVTIYRYGRETGPTALARLVREARIVAESIRTDRP